MRQSDRLSKIITMVNKRGYVSVSQLSDFFNVTKVTIRRDLEKLHSKKQVFRTHGGASSSNAGGLNALINDQTNNGPLAFTQKKNVDVLIITPSNKKTDAFLLNQASKQEIPVISEATLLKETLTYISIDNYKASYELGQWAAAYARNHFKNKARILDITYPLPSTKARSQGFIDGINADLDDCKIVLSVNSQTHFQTAYQLTRDAIEVHNDGINIIFALNATTALGANQACKHLGIDPSKILIVFIGFEGNSMKDVLMKNQYCKAGIAMFPKIAGLMCINMSIKAYNKAKLAEHTYIPHIILTEETLPDFFRKHTDGWKIRWGRIEKEFGPAYTFDYIKKKKHPALPKTIRHIVPFGKHEWYQQLESSMKDFCTHLNIELEVVNATQSLQVELRQLNQQIANNATRFIQDGDTIFLDDGEVTLLLAEEITDKDITVITNSLSVCSALQGMKNINLICTGGVIRANPNALVGPFAVHVISQTYADKLFLTTNSISLDSGLSHTNMDIVEVKKAMIDSSKEVILLANHSKFNQESSMKIAPISVADKLITDNALPASIRLELTQVGMEVILA
ncbi:MAG: substrate-binding domain-containing protein [Chloroflexi bacterium]|nr:substrate-binding domain-containing protein [Chloroflexota bacterium]